MKSSVSFIAAISFACALANQSLSQEAEYYNPVKRENIFHNHQGLAPLHLKNKTLVLDYKDSVKSVLHTIQKNHREQQKKESFLFTDNKTSIKHWKYPDQTIQLVYSKLQFDAGLVALEKEKSDEYSEQFVLIFTTPSSGIASKLQIGTDSRIKSITSNILFTILNK